MALALAVVTGLMACVAFVRVTSAERPPLANAVGADVSEIMVTDAAGHETSLASGEWTVAYVFNSNCGHCVAAAPGWREWTASHPDVPVVALSRESIEGAVGFAATYDWSVPVARVRVGWPDYGTRSFMARTPWVHVISPDGRIAATMHGADFDQLERSVRQFNSPSPEVDR